MSRSDADADCPRPPDERALDVSITTRDAGPGVVVVDHVERHRFELWTDEPVTPEPADAEAFRFPIDTAVDLSASGLTIPTVVQSYIRDTSGEMLAEVDQGTDVSFGDGIYEIEVCAPMKIYLRIEGPLEVTCDALRVRIEHESDRVRVGGRSQHDRPAATVTTTPDPEATMRAVSTFGSALKTTSPERSFPTLRGHPPLVELGDRLDVPRGLERPETGVRIVLPPKLGRIYVAAPLVHYLGAEVVPGETPRLVTDTGVDHSLDADGRGYERAVRETLELSLLLDSVVRTEGLYQVDLRERTVVDRRVDLDMSALYDAPLAERLAAYLDVGHGTIADLVPDWGLVTHVEPDPENVAVLPYLTDDLAVVRTPSATRSDSSPAKEATRSFFRSSGSTSPEPTVGSSFVRPEQTDAIEQAWVGDGAPLGATKALPEAYDHRLDRSPTEADIGITVVCNDSEMAAELDVTDEVYGERYDLPFDVTVRERLTRDELREALTSPANLFHYVGHIDEQGFECVDGHLDATTLDEVGVEAFLLNACQSYEQGVKLVEAGAVAGIVTLSDVINESAIRMGRLLARLLNRGFPLTGALDIAGTECSIGDQYTVVGDGRVTLARVEGNPPYLLSTRSVGEDLYRVEYRTYPTRQGSVGAMVIPYVGDNEEHYLHPGTLDTFEVDDAGLAELFALEPAPVRFGGELRWTEEVELDGR